MYGATGRSIPTLYVSRGRSRFGARQAAQREFRADPRGRCGQSCISVFKRRDQAPNPSGAVRPGKATRHRNAGPPVDAHSMLTRAVDHVPATKDAPERAWLCRFSVEERDIGRSAQCSALSRMIRGAVPMGDRFRGGGHQWSADSCPPRPKPWAIQPLS